MNFDEKCNFLIKQLPVIGIESTYKINFKSLAYQILTYEDIPLNELEESYNKDVDFYGSEAGTLSDHLRLHYRTVALSVELSELISNNLSLALTHEHPLIREYAILIQSKNY